MKIAAKGGIEAVLTAMEANELSSEVQSWGCSALLSVASERAGWGIFSFSGAGARSETFARILAGGAAALVRKALAAFPKEKDLQSKGKMLLGTLGVKR